MSRLKFNFFIFCTITTLVGAVTLTKHNQNVKLASLAEKFTLPPAVVTSIQVEEQLWDKSLSSPGELEAAAGVMMRAELAGRIEKIFFKSGETANKGDLLLQQDISTEKKQLNAAKAAAFVAKKSFERAKLLIKRKDISQEEYEQLEASYLQLEAQADSIQSIIKKKSIYAPFSGRLGISQVDLGQLLSPNDPIVTLQDTETLLVNFFLPQKKLSNVFHNQRIQVIPEDGLDVTKLSGFISAISPEIDSKTRNIHIQAKVQNLTGLLKPGMFVDVKVILNSSSPTLSIPTTAVLYAPYGSSVYVIEEAPNGKKSVRQQFIRLGESRGDFIAVKKGLKLGQNIVSTGLFKLFNGQNVVIDNALSPKFSLDPSLKDS